jgi:hypothetical protein
LGELPREHHPAHAGRGKTPERAFRQIGDKEKGILR